MDVSKCPCCARTVDVVEIPRTVRCPAGLPCGAIYSMAEPEHRCGDYVPGRLWRCTACHFLWVTTMVLPETTS